MQAPYGLIRPADLFAARRAFSVARGSLTLFALTGLLTFAAPTAQNAVLARTAPPQAPDMPADPLIGSVDADSIPAAAAERTRAREQRALAEFIAKRYRVAEEAIASFVSSAYRAGDEHRVDPLLILAVVAVESRFNPVAESVLGAKGLMQVLPKYHQDKLFEHGGEAALLEPEINIQVGTQILREYLRRSGETEAALQMYAGAWDAPTPQYSGKVLAERARLQQSVARVRRAAA